MVILDASVLIALAKIRRLHLVRETFKEVLIGPVVHEEVVVAGRRIRALGVEQVENCIEEGWLRVIRPTPAERRLTARIIQTSRLHLGEAETLAIAVRRRWRVIVDDKEARSVADALHLDYIGTAGSLLEAFMKGHLALEGLENALLDLSRVIWLSPGVVATILKVAREEQ